MPTIRALPMVAGDGAALYRMLDSTPAATLAVRGGTEVTSTSVGASTTRAHLLAADPDRLFDPRVSRANTQTTDTLVAPSAAQVDLSIIGPVPLGITGSSARSDAERAATMLMLDDGMARGVLMSGDEQWHAGRVVMADRVIYSDADGLVRSARVGDRGFTQSTFRVGGPYDGSPPVNVERHALGSLDLRNNLPIDPDTSPIRKAFVVQDDVALDIDYRARLGELKSIVARDGLLPLD